MIADVKEKIIAPLPRPEPFFKAKSQNVFARTYDPSAAAANSVPPRNDQFLEKMSATNSKKIRTANGISQLIIIPFQRLFLLRRSRSFCSMLNRKTLLGLF